MSQHVQELSRENKDEEMPINVINNAPSDVANRSEILSNAGTNRNTSHSTVPNSFNRSLKTISDELKKFNQEIIELDRKVQNFQYLTLGFIIICTIALFLKK